MTVDPYLWNERAIRAWQRAGFIALEEREPDDEWHTARWLLMEFRPFPSEGAEPPPAEISHQGDAQ